MNGKSSGDEKSLDLAAAEWHVKRDRGLSPAEQDEFLNWLAADSRHGEWLARHQATWREFDLLAQWRPEHSKEPNPDLLANQLPFRPRWRRGWTALGVAAGIAALLFAGYSAQTSGESTLAAVETAARGYERRELGDGSVVELNRGARVVVEYLPTERRVKLVQGEAQFTVAKNAQRPFVVFTPNIQVRAVGTAFNVRVDPADVKVFVTEGRVRLDGAAIPASAGSSLPSITAPELIAGQRAVVSSIPHTPLKIEAISGEEVARLLSWQPQLLDFASTPLIEVVAEFNRRNERQLTVAEAELERMPIVASFRSDNLDGFLRLLEISGVRVEQRAGGKIVLRKAR